MKQKRRDDLIYSAVLLGAIALAVALMVLAHHIDQVLLRAGRPWSKTS